MGQPHEVFAEFSVNLKERAMLSFQLMEFAVLTGLPHDIETVIDERMGKDVEKAADIRYKLYLLLWLCVLYLKSHFTFL